MPELTNDELIQKAPSVILARDKVVKLADLLPYTDWYQKIE